MENAQASEAKKPEITETEVYFNSLLKSQEESLKSVPSKRIKLVPILVLVLVVGVGLFYAMSFYVRANNLNSSISENASSDNAGAYFNPSYYTNRERKISGKIDRNFNQSNNHDLDFALIGNDGKTVAYLYSENNDLSLSVGLSVEIQGQFKVPAPDGKEVIEVQSIKLK